MVEEFRQQLIESSQKQREQRGDDISSGSSELRHKMKNSKMIKVSDIFSSDSSSL